MTARSQVLDMNLSKIDLNLFTVFDAIYREGGITPASRRLHLSQPAVSHALARLRELLNDPLFERHGNDMVPTPKARSLAATIGQSLGNLEQMMHRAGQFDPATSARSFTIAVRESYEPAFLPALTARVCREAPGVNVATVRIERRDVEEDLQGGELDAAIDVTLPLSAEVRRERLSAEPLVVMARAAHPVVQRGLDLETYLSVEHVLVTGRRRGGGYEDIALGRLGMSRHIRVRCQQHGAASAIVSRTDLLATMPRNQAQWANVEAQNQLFPFPIDIAPMELFLYWHATADEDPASRWFRKLALEILQEGPAPFGRGRA
jgi:DNA-binding transcriptional LysR family regulator